MKKYLLAVLILSSFFSINSYAGNWIHQKGIWKYEDNGKYVANEWKWIDGNNDGIAECYYFDKKGNLLVNTKTPDGYSVDKNGAWTSNGKVVTKSVKAEESSDFRNALLGEWQNFSGRWWFRKNDGSYPVSSWQWIDGNKDGMAECYYFDKEGWLLTSTKTPDGYMVNENGEWISNGVVQRKSTINKANQVAKAKGGGGGAGGSGSSSRVSGGGGSGGRYTGGSSSSSSEEDDEFNPNAKYSIYTYRDKSDDSVSYSLNDYDFGNWRSIQEEQQDEVEERINEWIAQNNILNLKDFEKVIEICNWLSDITEYQIDRSLKTHTAYGAIVNGKAQCAGYADAFLQIAKRVGLEAKYVTGGNHAWNIVKLDGYWHNVDPTWIDGADWRWTKRPKSKSKRKEIFLEHNNWEYLFFTDDDVRESENDWFKKHHTRHYPEPEANGRIYGKKHAEIYLRFGTEEQRVKLREKVNRYLEQKGRIFEYSTMKDESNRQGVIKELKNAMDNAMRTPHQEQNVAIKYYDYDENFAPEINEELEEWWLKKHGNTSQYNIEKGYHPGSPPQLHWADFPYNTDGDFVRDSRYGYVDTFSYMIFSFVFKGEKREDRIIQIQYVNNNKTIGMQVEPVITKQRLILKVPEGYKITPPTRSNHFRDRLIFDKKGKIGSVEWDNVLMLKYSSLQINKLDEDNHFRIGVSPIDE